MHLFNGTIFETDMIIGADGQHSTVRSSVLEKEVKPKGTGTIVLMGNIPIREILEDDFFKSGIWRTHGCSGLVHVDVLWVRLHSS